MDLVPKFIVVPRTESLVYLLAVNWGCFWLLEANELPNLVPFLHLESHGWQMEFLVPCLWQSWKRFFTFKGSCNEIVSQKIKNRKFFYFYNSQKCPISPTVISHLRVLTSVLCAKFPGIRADIFGDIIRPTVLSISKYIINSMWDPHSTWIFWIVAGRGTKHWGPCAFFMSQQGAFKGFSNLIG